MRGFDPMGERKHMGDPTGVDSARDVPELSAADQKAILGANAAKLLGIKTLASGRKIRDF
jgi:hypothetical protein